MSGSDDVSARLAAVSSSSQSSAEKVSSYISLLDGIFSSSSNSSSLQASLQKFIDVVAADSTSLVISKQVVAAFVKRLSEAKDVDNELRQNIAEKTLELLSQRQASFEEQVRSRYAVIIATADQICPRSPRLFPRWQSRYTHI